MCNWWGFHLENDHSAAFFKVQLQSSILKAEIQLHRTCIDDRLVSSQALGRRGPRSVQSEDSNHDLADSRQEVPQFWLRCAWLLPWPGPQRVQTLALPGKIQNEAPHHCSKDTNKMHSTSPGYSSCRHTAPSSHSVPPWLMLRIVLQFGEPELVLQHTPDLFLFLAMWDEFVPVVIGSAVCLCVCCGVLITHVSSIRVLC